MSILRLKELLKEKSISGKALSDKIGISQPAVSDIVKGKSFPRPDLLLKIANALDVDIKDLFNSTKESEKQTILYTKDENGNFKSVGNIKI